MASRKSLLTAFTLGFATLAAPGCQRTEPAPEPNRVESPQKKEDPPKATDPVEYARLHQSFRDAVLFEKPPSEQEQRPPDTTVAGKVVGKIYDAIAGKDYKGGLWDEVRFRTAEGKEIVHWAVIKTKLGDIELQFYPDYAPNHVRSFLALAKSGYFDGLPIYRSIRQGEGEDRVAYIESGCPKGTGEQGYGSVGYWLKPEIHPKAVHDEGALAAWHGEVLESAACKFYITADRCPQLDGMWTVFGKVTRGLDVVRAINSKEVDELDRLKEPVPILNVEILTR